MKQIKRMPKKVLAVVISVMILVSMMPLSVIMASAAEGTIEALVGGATVSGNIVTFANTELNWHAADPLVGRNVNGWWVGIKVTAPDTLVLENAKYKDAQGVEKSFNQFKDSTSEPHFIQLWGLVNETHLNDAILGNKNVVYAYEFDWDGDGNFEQPVTMEIDPTDIVLKKGSETVYPKTSGLANVTAITNGVTVEGNETNKTVVQNTSDITLEWVAKDTTIGRNQDGWWIGFNVEAPAGYDAEKASYQHKTSTGWDTEHTQYFKDNKDTETGIQVWLLVNKEYLDAALAKTEGEKVVNYITRYDWDGDGVYEQIVHTKIDPQKIVLIDEDENVIFDLNRQVPDLEFKAPISSTYLMVAEADNKYDFSATTNSTGAITYSTSDSGIAIIDANGNLTVKGTGAVDVIAFVASDDNYIAREIKTTLEVKEDKTDPEIDTPIFSEDLDEDDTNNNVISNGELTVTVTATDAESGIAGLEYSLDNGANFEKINGNSFVIDNNFRNTVLIKAIDKAGNEVCVDNGGKIVIVDKLAPDVVATYQFATDSTQYAKDENTIHTNDDITVNVTVTESNIDLTPDKKPVIKVNDAEIADFSWTVDAANGTGTASFVLSAEGTYNYEISFEDIAKNEGSYESDKTLVIDKTAPEVTDFTSTTENWTNQNVTISANVNDTVSGVKSVFVKVDSGEWQETAFAGGAYSLTVENQGEFTYSFKWVDNVGNVSTEVNKTVKIDKTAPKAEITNLDPNGIVEIVVDIINNIKKIFDYHDAAVTLEIYASEDQNTPSGIAKVEYKTEGGEYAEITDFDFDAGIAEIEIPAEYRGGVYARITDNAGNVGEYKYLDGEDEVTLVIDTIVPQFAEATYDFTGVNNAVGEGEDKIYYTNDEVEITLNLDAANFDLAVKPTVKISKNGGEAEPQENLSWVAAANGTTNQATFTLALDELNDEKFADFVVSANFEDRLGRVAEFETEVHIDNDAPIIAVTYNDIPANNGNKYKDTRIATIEVNEHNFDPNNVVLNVTAKDITGADVDISEEDYANNAKTAANWKYKDANGDFTDDESLAENQNLHYLELEFATDAIYTLDVTVTDLAENASEKVEPVFVVDKTPAEIVSVKYETTVIKKILSSIFFADTDIRVVVTLRDQTSGVDRVSLTHLVVSEDENGNIITTPNGEPKLLPVTQHVKPQPLPPSSFGTVEDSYDNSYFQAKFTIDAVSKSKFALDIDDAAGNNTQNNVADDPILVGDETAPEVTITYSVEEGTAVQYVDANKNTVKDFNDPSTTQAYYDGDVTTTIEVVEANFFKEDVKVSVNGTEQSGLVWNEKTGAENTYYATITLVDDGDYEVKFEYTDRSGNNANITSSDADPVTKEYTSKDIIIDTLDPMVTVVYNHHDCIAEIDGREYYNDKSEDKVRSVTITVDEHNFREADFELSVAALNSAGANIENNTNTDTAWVHDGDKHTRTITFNTQANYTFDYEFSDLAKNPATDYEADEFTYDYTAPDYVSIKYVNDVESKDGIIHQIEDFIEKVTFGIIYFKDPANIEVTVTDDVAGVDEIYYNYILLNEDVSKVNAGSKDEIKVNAVHTQGTNQFKATINVPAESLNENNQFNGTINFRTVDRATNESQTVQGETIVVVDSRPPVLQEITFNDPLQKTNDVSYYNGDINAKIVINEANFFSEDVNVTVTRDDVDYPVNVKWVNDSVDIHTGTFTLTEEGHYVVKVEYTDRSTNKMETFTSNLLTIDRTDPVINVTGVEHQSANNQETISFTVSVTDVNIPVEGFKPTLTAVVKNVDAEGNETYTTIPIDLGAPTQTVTNGVTTYSYTVTNLAVDGFYSLVCSAEDFAGHKVENINTVGGGNTATMNFSVNREGSVFWLETEHNDKYATDPSNMIKDELNGTYANDKVVVKLHEINVDVVDENADQQTVFVINDGSGTDNLALVAGANYSKNVMIGTGGWYETVYTLNNDTPFDHDGTYSFNVITYDKANNSNVNTEFDEGVISFTLDQTNPVITTNVKSDHRENAADFWVEFEITDANIDTDSIAINLTDNKGKVINVERIDLGNNEYKFHVEQGINYDFEITAKDKAGNPSESCKVENLTVSTNFLVLWYANTPLFWGSIAAAVLLAGSIVVVVVLKKKKDQ